jgi:hypothetical protein
VKRIFLSEKPVTNPESPIFKESLKWKKHPNSKVPGAKAREATVPAAKAVRGEEAVFAVPAASPAVFAPKKSSPLTTKISTVSVFSSASAVRSFPAA